MTVASSSDQLQRYLHKCARTYHTTLSPAAGGLFDFGFHCERGGRESYWPDPGDELQFIELKAPLMWVWWCSGGSGGGRMGRNSEWWWQIGNSSYAPDFSFALPRIPIPGSTAFVAVRPHRVTKVSLNPSLKLSGTQLSLAHRKSFVNEDFKGRLIIIDGKYQFRSSHPQTEICFQSAVTRCEYVNRYVPCVLPAPTAAKRRQRSPRACLGGRKWRARCRSSKSTCRGSTSCSRVTRRTSSADHPRRLDRSRWWYLASFPPPASLSGSPAIWEIKRDECGSINKPTKYKQHHLIRRLLWRLSFYCALGDGDTAASCWQGSACRSRVNAT